MLKVLLGSVLVAAGTCQRGGGPMPTTGGMLQYDGTIGVGQRVAFTQTLQDGRAVACVDGKKPGGVEFQGHLEVVRLGDGTETVISRGDSWRVQPTIYEWSGWCELVGDVKAGDLIRLVSETGAAGVFHFRITLRSI